MVQQQHQRAAIFAFADSLSQHHHGRMSSILSLSPDSGVWLSHALTLAQGLALPFAFYFKPVVVLLAMSWLIYRAYQVLNEPLEHLAQLLGFDIPSAPLIDLATVKGDGAIVHWSRPEKQKQHKTTHRYEIHLNGSLIETLPINETAATITGLQPGSFYVVRVSLVNNFDFSSKSDPIRFRTKYASDADFFAPSIDGHDTDADTIPEPVPRARPFRGLKHVNPVSSPDSSPMTREGSTGALASGAKKNSSGRRPSPGVLEVPRNAPLLPPEDIETSESADIVTQLTEKLEAIRQETCEAETQAKEEEEEEARQKEELVKERDELRTDLHDKQRASRNLKNEVNAMERQNTAAHNERSKHERMLQQKKLERQKLAEDTARYVKEAESLAQDVERVRQDMTESVAQAAREKEELRSKQAAETALIKGLDDEVKEKSNEIKKREHTIKGTSTSGVEPAEPNLVQQLQQEAEERRAWDMQYQAMQQQYAATVQKLEQAKRFHAEQIAFLESQRARRRQQDEATAHYSSPPATQERSLRRGDSQRSRKAASGHSSSDSPRLTNFGSTPVAASNPSSSSIFGGAPFMNIHNGMTLMNHGSPGDDLSMSDEERERMTGGAPMSPGAGADLLPTDLFSDGDQLSSEFIRHLPGLGALPGLPTLPGPPIGATYPDPGPASPVSAGGSSRSHSVFMSPQASQQNLHIGSPEHIMDADRRSIRSTRSTRAASGGAGPSGPGSRFGGMFGIKQRTKTASADEGPALSKASSMPRQDHGIAGIDSGTRKRNSSISGSGFSGASLGGDVAFEQPTLPASRRSKFNIFSKAPAESNSGWPQFASFGRRPASPRPGSTHSNELPRPSIDSSRSGAYAWDAGSGARSSPLAFGAGWNTPGVQQARMYGSRHPSRRPSQQHGMSGPPDDIMEDEDSDILDFRQEHGAHLGPIGSKPPPVADIPKLNPAAKEFKNFFSNISLTKSKTREVPSSASGTPNMGQGDYHDDLSPPNSRKSKDTRDTHSLTESSTAESGRTSADLARTPSYSNSEAAVPSPFLAGSSAGKESFMQRLSRKSSSGKFTLPTFKREKSKLDTQAPPTSAPPNEDDEDVGSMSASVSSEKFGRESISKEKESGRGSGRSWSNVFSKSGKGKKGSETPSIEGLSGDGEEE